MSNAVPIEPLSPGYKMLGKKGIQVLIHSAHDWHYIRRNLVAQLVEYSITPEMRECGFDSHSLKSGDYFQGKKTQDLYTSATARYILC